MYLLHNDSLFHKYLELEINRKILRKKCETKPKSNCNPRYRFETRRFKTRRFKKPGFPCSELQKLDLTHL